jgi:hypothetical protein
MKQEDNRNDKGRARMRSLTRAAILALLNWDEEAYAWFQYEQGLIYLNAYLNGQEFKEYGVRLLEENATFWNWWKNHWAQRDELFLDSNHRSPIYSIDEARKLYTQQNSGSMLAQNIHPNSVVLNDSYERMTSDIVEREIPVRA